VVTNKTKIPSIWLAGLDQLIYSNYRAYRRTEMPKLNFNQEIFIFIWHPAQLCFVLLSILLYKYRPTGVHFASKLPHGPTESPMQGWFPDIIGIIATRSAAISTYNYPRPPCVKSRWRRAPICHNTRLLLICDGLRLGQMFRFCQCRYLDLNTHVRLASKLFVILILQCVIPCSYAPLDSW